MAASSPVVLSNNNGGEATATASPIASTPPPPSPATTSPAPATTNAVKSPGALPTITLQRTDPPKNQRGLNKPKCIMCGNVARSRCPYQSCKSCCSKAQNPCHIHVLKQNATLADRGASANATIPEQQPSEVPPSGPLVKVSSLRQLSSTFSQFNNVHAPLRSRKPLTRKEALTINEWRFAKLKEFRKRNIEVENEAFDRYMQNISLLEEVFDVNPERPETDTSSVSNPPTTSGDRTEMISEMKVKLRSNPLRIEKFRKRIQETVEQGLKKLKKCASLDGVHINNSLNDAAVNDLTPKAPNKWWGGKTSALVELNDRLNKARSEEDLKLCIQMKSKIKGQQRKVSSQNKTEGSEILKEQVAPKDVLLAKGSDISLLKLVKSTEIDEDALKSMDSYFSSLEEIEDL